MRHMNLVAQTALHLPLRGGLEEEQERLLAVVARFHHRATLAGDVHLGAEAT